MVLDWNKQIDECIRNNKIMPIFHGNLISYGLEHKYIIKRLEQMGYTNEQMLNWMLVAESELIYNIDSLEEMKKDADKKKMPPKREYKVFVTKPEIDYINALETTRENKAFLLGMICYVKMMKVKTKGTRMKNRCRSYIYYFTFGKDDYWNGRQRYRWIEPFVHELCSKGIIEIEQKPTRYTLYTCDGPVAEEIEDLRFKADWVDWDATDGFCIKNIDTDVKALVDLAIEERVGECAICKKLFRVTPYTKTKLCPTCQKAERQKKKNEWFLEHPDYKHDKSHTHAHGKVVPLGKKPKKKKKASR